MRDLVYKNLFSGEKKRRIISSSEISHNNGMRSIIRRHFIYMIKPVDGSELNKPSPHLYILKEKNTKEQREKFFFRIKGSIYALNSQSQPIFVIFMHSLKITFASCSEISNHS